MLKAQLSCNKATKRGNWVAHFSGQVASLFRIIRYFLTQCDVIEITAELQILNSSNILYSHRSNFVRRNYLLWKWFLRKQPTCKKLWRWIIWFLQRGALTIWISATLQPRAIKDFKWLDIQCDKKVKQ